MTRATDEVARRAGPEPAMTTLARLLPARGSVGGTAGGSADGRADPLAGYRPVLRGLLRALARGCSARYAALWMPDRADGSPLWTPVVAWRAWRAPWGGGLPASVGDPARLSDVDGVVATVEVRVGRSAVLVLAHREGPGPGAAEVAALGDTAVAVGLLLGEAAAWAAAATARADADRMLHDVGVMQLELSTVQAVERDRLATAVTTATGRHLRAIVDDTAALTDALRSEGPEAAALVATIRGTLDTMIGHFRTVVRGVYPQVLRGSGVAAALREGAAALPVRVEFDGDLGRRQGWAVESGLYQAAASAIDALCATGGDEPVRVGFARAGDVLTIRVERVGVDPDRIRRDLHDDARRLAALGGGLAVRSRSAPAATVLVDIRLPERWGGPTGEGRPPGSVRTGGGPAADDRSSARLRELLMSASDRPGAGVPVRVAVDRQDGGVRVAVAGPATGALTRRLCGPSIQVADGACYRHGPGRQVVVEPVGDASPWRQVRLGQRSASDPSTLLDDRWRTVVETPDLTLPGLRLVPYRRRADRVLATHLRSWSALPDGPPDVVVLALDGPLSSAQFEFLSALRSADGDEFVPAVICVEQAGSGTDPKLAAWCDEVTDVDGLESVLRAWVFARAGLLAARWALRGLETVTGAVDGPFARAVEAAVAAAPEVAELDLLEALQGRRILLPHGHDDALRLLGAHGRDPHARLGLAREAGAAQVRGAAVEALEFWRTEAMRPGPGTAGRRAYASLVRVSERLLTGES